MFPFCWCQNLCDLVKLNNLFLGRRVFFKHLIHRYRGPPSPAGEGFYVVAFDIFIDANVTLASLWEGGGERSEPEGARGIIVYRSPQNECFAFVHASSSLHRSAVFSLLSEEGLKAHCIFSV